MKNQTTKEKHKKESIDRYWYLPELDFGYYSLCVWCVCVRDIACNWNMTDHNVLDFSAPIGLEASVSRPFDKSLSVFVFLLLFSSFEFVYFLFRWNAKKSHPTGWNEAHVSRIDAIAICAVERSLYSLLWKTAMRQTLFSNSWNQSQAYGMKSMAITTNTVRKITPNLVPHSRATMRSQRRRKSKCTRASASAKQQRKQNKIACALVASRCRWFDFNILALNSRTFYTFTDRLRRKGLFKIRPFSVQ